MATEDGRVRRAEQNRKERHAALKVSSLQVFAERGYHNTSVTDLVKAAGVARGTFYLYFDSKDALFLELLDDLLATLKASVKGVKAGPEAPPLTDQLETTVAGILHTVASNRPLTQILFREAVGLDDAVEARLTGFNQDLHDYTAAALQLGQATGAVRESLDVEIAATCIVGGVRELVNRYVIGSDSPPDVQRLAAGVVDYALGGVR